MLTLTSEYALCAVVYLGAHAELCPVPSRVIAHDLRIPPKYLGLVLGRLVRAGVLVASPGSRGGFRLARPARAIRLLDVIEPFEMIDANRRRCPFRNRECDHDNACTGHTAWMKVADAYYTFLANTSVADITLTPPRREKKKRRR